MQFIPHEECTCNDNISLYSKIMSFPRAGNADICDELSGNLLGLVENRVLLSV